MKKFLDANHPMLRPLWVRVLLVALCLGWAALEFATMSPFWGMVFLALGGPTRIIPAPRIGAGRLTGGWAFLLSLLLGSVFFVANR